ncbi:MULTISPECIES: SDR family oxidoreductase [unclassified Ruminococcus]|uniref:SDR family NAD(P)-dependent oxidoreductase n=1 Tax=unclassified Ruminococcus TaxID=2608920 RepID=UPI00210D6BD5|nr:MULTISPECIES: SDR family oxidoreductase [unclassified Ruminococcus]MCQ4022646.1 SDR family NAD(P)-dependent oxidoreductase [Ruminococcus sp. zg-924]MCQ4114886.1 SDR family NAD(P)-dependent oxidoreductase [Ruminococcus sp. zg-921]
MDNYTLITGASSGIGKEFAKAFAKRGDNLILVSRSKDKLEIIAKNLREKHGIKVEVIALDLSLEHIADTLYNEVISRKLTVDKLINNAGFATTGLLHTTDYLKQHEEIMLNVTTMTELTYLFIKDMSKAGRGAIINLGSCVSFTPFPYSAVYAATKAYILSFTESISYEYRNRGVRVFAVCPGPTQTHFFDKSGNVTDNMRTPAQVVKTALKTLDNSKRAFKTDGALSKMQSVVHRFAPRGAVLNIVGRISGKAWGPNRREN